MIIYNVTLSMDEETAPDWLSWMRDVHIPAVMATGLFSGYRLHRMITNLTGEGITYCVQYELHSHDDMVSYQTQHAPRLQLEHRARYGDHVMAFRSVMEVIY